MRVLYILCLVPLFVSAIVVIAIGIVTLPLLMALRLISAILPAEIGNSIMRSARSMYVFPAYCIRDAGTFVDQCFKRYRKAD